MALLDAKQRSHKGHRGEDSNSLWVSDYGGHLQWRRGLELLSPVGDVEQAVATLTGLALPHPPHDLSEPEVDGGHLGHDGRDLLRGRSLPDQEVSFSLCAFPLLSYVAFL